MTSDELRAAFLAFFERQGHKVLPSSSLIPHGDPTLLLTNAGMVQVKPYFLGEATPPSRRLASCQKCFRTTDIEAVGDSTHLTFFEMLGNFSVGDYFKNEAIGWAWEFVTRDLAIPQDRLWVTILTDDDEAFNIWRQSGVPESRIVRLGEKDNFWGPAGSSGPCGPCSEIHFDFGEDCGCRRASCAPGCECGRFSEIWNLVFTEYNQDEAGRRTRLPRSNIDTGMGLERTAAVLQGKESVYEIDLFQPLVEKIAWLSGVNYGADMYSDNAIRIIAEHSRGIAFLIADGVLPDNEGRGYVLRRLLRRAALFGRRLGLEKSFLTEMAAITVEWMGHTYPELTKRRNFITKVVQTEEGRFGETLSTGLELIEGIMAGGGKVISGADAFRLYDTYGFPIASTAEIAAERGLSLDMEGFEREMARQRARARAAHKFDLAEREAWPEDLELAATVFTGYNELELATSVAAIIVDSRSVDTVSEGQEAGLVLAATPFYAEMGGQVGDTGVISGPTGRFEVTDTVLVPDSIIVHKGRVVEGSLGVGDAVVAGVDVERRQDIARNHTATHLLQYALRQVLGEQVQQRGSLVAPERFRFDFSYLEAMTLDEIQRVQQIVNERIRQNHRVYAEEVACQQAVNEGAIALFEEKYGDVVRVLKIGEPPFSIELCGGTHVNSTGEIGYFHIIGESSIGTGLRRIEAVTGRGASEYVDRHLSQMQRLAESLGTEPGGLVEKVRGLQAELDGERKTVRVLERQLGRATADALIKQAKTVRGVTLIAARVLSARIEVLREISDRIRDNIGSGIIVLGSVYDGKPVFIAAVTPDLVAKGYQAGKIVGQVAKVTGGGGGGRPTLAQAGGRDGSKIDEALQLVESLI